MRLDNVRVPDAGKFHLDGAQDSGPGQTDELLFVCTSIAAVV